MNKSGNPADLPRELGDGLLLRWATAGDVEALAAFNIEIHSDNPEEPETWLGEWTQDLMRGDHPTTGASDFTVVVDQKAEDQIVSSLCLISQRWTYEDVPFGVGRPELVGTDPEYRRRGLVREQMEAVHALSAARDELVQAITGIPWYYRLFGYEMALDLGGERLYPRDRLAKLKAPEEEVYRVRPATVADIPLLDELYASHCAHSLVSRPRDEALWRHEMTVPHESTVYYRRLYIVERIEEEEPAGYFEYFEWPKGVVVREMAAQPGHSLRAVALRALRFLKEQLAEKRPADDPPKPLLFGMGAVHPVYEALGQALVRQREPYAWYIRVPDLQLFLETIRPVLERRLAQSVMAGHTGTLRLNFFTERMTIELENGQVAGFGTYEPVRLEEGDFSFPDLTFLQLLFGRRSVDELAEAYADCGGKEEARILLNILFPKQHSQVLGLG